MPCTDTIVVNDDPISAAVKLFADVINIHPFEDENGRLCQVMLSHVLMQGGCSLFLVLLSFVPQAKAESTTFEQYEDTMITLRCCILWLLHHLYVYGITLSRTWNCWKNLDSTIDGKEWCRASVCHYMRRKLTC